MAEQVWRERRQHVGWIDGEGMLIPLAHRPLSDVPDDWQEVYVGPTGTPCQSNYCKEEPHVL